jgi:hypothetical protein
MSERFNPCADCDEAWHGLIRSKIETEERLRQMQSNHDGALRLYSQWRSRAEKAEAELAANLSGTKP